MTHFELVDRLFEAHAAGTRAATVSTTTGPLRFPLLSQSARAAELQQGTRRARVGPFSAVLLPEST